MAKAEPIRVPITLEVEGVGLIDRLAAIEADLAQLTEMVRRLLPRGPETGPG